MTGTSMDGLDICVSKIKFFLKSINVEVIKVGYVEFPKKIKLNIENSLSLKKEDIKTCHKSLGEFMAKETHQFIKKNKISNIDAVGMHGQTIEHVSGVKSLQIGDPKYLLNKLNVPIISNFRNLDIKNGGTGAPLVPFLDKILFQEEKNAVLCLNIGGISNITFLPSLESIKNYSKSAGLILKSYHSYGNHYSKTLSIWRKNFINSWSQISKQGFDNSFKRIWEFYLSYCEAGFKSKNIDLIQFSVRNK